MSVLVVVIAVALLAVVVFVISAPLRTGRTAQDAGAAQPTLEPASMRQHELEVAREAKYREIRDAELDYRTGKLSRADYEAVDAALRAEAVQILDRLEDAERG
jgi:flagellar biosynthesis/type III secretory pathway M-ring protein FliF/YscJ